VLVLGAIYLFRVEVAHVIDSARSRGIRIKVGGQELTIDEASKQQGTLIADLQAQVVNLREAVLGAGLNVPAAEAAVEPATANDRSALWVDDEPKNNSYLIQLLIDSGVDVDLALTTADGLKRFAGRRYDMVLSDIGRPEGSGFNRTAGLTLLAEIRKTDRQILFVFFTSGRSAREHRAEAERLGASITNSATEVAEQFKQVFAAQPGAGPSP
jgi:CheY-like chemotaxis protein